MILIAMTIDSATLRTTVTLDDDVQTVLAREAYRQGKSFKATLNEAVRAGLARGARKSAKSKPPSWPVHNIGRALVDLDKAGALANELDDRATLAKMRRGA